MTSMAFLAVFFAALLPYSLVHMDTITSRQALSSRRKVPFSLTAPIPPLTFFDGETRIARLRHHGVEGVEDAGVLAAAGEAFEPRVHFSGILLRELGDGVDSEEVEIAQHSGSDGDETFETTF